MKNIVKIAGFIAILAIIGFMTGCPTEPEATPEDQVKIIITDLPAALEGKYININLWENVADKDPKAASFIPLSKVINGRVNSSMVFWGSNEKAFGETGEYVISLGIYNDDRAQSKTKKGSDPTVDSEVYRAGTPKKTISKDTNTFSASDFSPSLAIDFPATQQPGQKPAQDFWGTYTGTSYKSGITETIQLAEYTFRISDNENTPEDFLAFIISKWDAAEVPSKYSGYTQGFKFTGYIGDGRPNTDYVYGTQTAPGFTQADITAMTRCHMYLYTKTEGNTITFIRTTFTKEDAQTDTTDAVTNGTALRVFTKQ